MLPKTQAGHWKEFYDSARHNDILDERTTLLIHLATSMAVACDP